MSDNLCHPIVVVVMLDALVGLYGSVIYDLDDSAKVDPPIDGTAGD